jgi:hypothetical protein
MTAGPGSENNCGHVLVLLELDALIGVGLEAGVVPGVVREPDVVVRVDPLPVPLERHAPGVHRPAVAVEPRARAVGVARVRREAVVPDVSAVPVPLELVDASVAAGRVAPERVLRRVPVGAVRRELCRRLRSPCRRSSRTRTRSCWTGCRRS